MFSCDVCKNWTTDVNVTRQGKQLCAPCLFYRGQQKMHNLPPEKPRDCGEDVKHELLAAAGHNFCWRCGSCVQKENPTHTSSQILIEAIEGSLSEFEMVRRNAVLGRKSKSRISNIRVNLQRAMEKAKRVYE